MAKIPQIGKVHLGVLDQLKAAAGKPDFMFPPGWAGTLREVATVLGLPLETVLSIHPDGDAPGAADNLIVEVVGSPKSWKGDLSR